MIRWHPLRADGGGDGDGGGGDGAAAAAAFRESLPEEYRTDAMFKDINDLGSLAKSYAAGQKMIGSDKVVIPGAEASDEERAAFFDAIGRPSDDKGYIVPEEGLPEKFGGFDETRVGAFRDAAHKMGLTKQQFAGILRWDAGYTNDQIAGMEKTLSDERAAGEASLRSQWGEAYEERLGFANDLVSHYADPKFAEYLEESGLISHPSMVKFLADVGKQFAQDDVIGKGKRGFKLSQDEAKEQIKMKKRDDEFQKALNTRNHPGHKDAVQEMKDLFEKAYGTEPAPGTVSA